MVLNVDNLFANQQENEIFDQQNEFGLGLEMIKIKTANETVASSSVLQDDNELFFPMQQNERYFFELHFLMSSTDDNDMKLTFVAPAGAVGFFGSEHSVITDDGTYSYNVISIPNGGVFGSVIRVDNYDNSTCYLVITGLVVNGGTVGNLQFQWSQAVSDTEATTVYAGSFIKYRIARGAI